MQSANMVGELLGTFEGNPGTQGTTGTDDTPDKPLEIKELAS